MPIKGARAELALQLLELKRARGEVRGVQKLASRQGQSLGRAAGKGGAGSCMPHHQTALLRMPPTAARMCPLPPCRRRSGSA